MNPMLIVASPLLLSFVVVVLWGAWEIFKSFKPMPSVAGAPALQQTASTRLDRDTAAPSANDVTPTSKFG